MGEAGAWNISYDDDASDGVAAMIRAAGGYVRPTDDLRPRVLEAARMQSGERSAKRRICQVGAIVVLLTLVTAADRGVDLAESRRAGMLAAAGFNELIVPTAASQPRRGDGEWRMIDAFTELRRQQAELLRFSM